MSALVVFAMSGIDSAGRYLDGVIMYLLTAERREPSNGRMPKHHGLKTSAMSAHPFRPG
jgi:hypothetical protein